MNLNIPGSISLLNSTIQNVAIELNIQTGSFNLLENSKIKYHTKLKIEVYRQLNIIGLIEQNDPTLLKDDNEGTVTIYAGYPKNATISLET
jgi:hypothetical protein